MRIEERGIGLPRRAWRTLIGMLLLVLVLAACGSETSDTTTTAEPSDATTTTAGPTDTTEPTEPDEPMTVGGGGELVIATSTEPQSLEAMVTLGEVNAPGLRNVLEQLTTYNPITGELGPMLATSWEQIEPTVWRFQIREGVMFHDGSPLNAESAAFAVNWVWGEEQAYAIRDFMGPQISAEVVDEYVIDVTTEEPDPILPNRLYFSSISSMEQILNDPDSHATNPIGTGPYSFVVWDRGQGWTAEANPDWWGIDAPDTYGEIFFDTLRFEFRPENQVRTAMVEAGEANIAMFATPEQCAAGDANPATKCITAPSLETLFIRFDQTHPALGDIRVREAILLAIDKESIITNVLGQDGTPAHQIVGPSAVGHNADLEPVPFDPDRAAELLAEAEADGVPLDLPLTIHIRQELIPRITEVAEAVAGMLTEVGLNVGIDVQEHATFGESFGIEGGPLAIPPDRGYITIHAHGNEILDYMASLNGYYNCESAGATWCDPEFDLLRAEVSVLTGEERDQRLQELAAYVNEAVAYGYIVHLSLAYTLDADIDWDLGLDHRLVAVQMRR
ncbi:MAG: ABC transporter substrate-binding protein [Acidimicrobiia bacterium]